MLHRTKDTRSLYIEEKWAWCEQFDAPRAMLYYETILSSNAAIPKARKSRPLPFAALRTIRV
jgi:hypothetical protein